MNNTQMLYHFCLKILYDNPEGLATNTIKDLLKRYNVLKLKESLWSTLNSSSFKFNPSMLDESS